ncbi:MAG: RNA polymerase sigma-70 factor [Flavipsychrobacter sp.]|nr:RNA polymerase sigma-70 factor [Flavipsychrobacter sp.]
MVKHSELSDNELFRLVGQGDHVIFEKIVTRFNPRLYSFACKMSKSDLWAEEIVQEVWVQVWLGRERIADLANPTSYLFTIAAHKIIDSLRKNKKELKAQYLLSQELNYYEECRSGYDVKLAQKIINQSIQQLPAQRQKVFELKYLEGYNYEQIANNLGISKNTVRNHMVKALESLRTTILQNDEFFFNFLGFWLVLSSLFFVYLNI